VLYVVSVFLSRFTCCGIPVEISTPLDLGIDYLNPDQYKTLLQEREVAWNQHLNNPKFLDLIKK
jgi:hypothetical protein